jgi:hypothetical protein
MMMRSICSICSCAPPFPAPDEQDTGTLAAAVIAVSELTRPPDDTYAEELVGRYALMRRFLPTFLHTLEFESTPGGRPVLNAIQFLRRMEGRHTAGWQAAPREVITRPWRRYVINRERRVDRPAYTLCVIDRLQEALRRHDVFVSPSDRWGDCRLSNNLALTHSW